MSDIIRQALEWLSDPREILSLDIPPWPPLQGDAQAVTSAHLIRCRVQHAIVRWANKPLAGGDRERVAFANDLLAALATRQTDWFLSLACGEEMEWHAVKQLAREIRP